MKKLIAISLLILMSQRAFAAITFVNNVLMDNLCPQAVFFVNTCNVAVLPNTPATLSNCTSAQTRWMDSINGVPVMFSAQGNFTIDSTNLQNCRVHGCSNDLARPDAAFITCNDVSTQTDVTFPLSR